MKAPIKLGSTCGFYRFSYGNYRFGQKVWCDINIKQNLRYSEAIPEQPPQVPVPVPAYPELSEQSALIDPPQPPPQVSPEEQLRNEYVTKAYNIHKDKQMKDNLMLLLEMGFSNFDKNFKLLKKHKGNLQEVANNLALDM